LSLTEDARGPKIVQLSDDVLASLESRLKRETIAKAPFCGLFATYISLGIIHIHARAIPLFIKVVKTRLPGERGGVKNKQQEEIGDEKKAVDMGRELEMTVLGYLKWIKTRAGERFDAEARGQYQVGGASGSVAQHIDEALDGYPD
jgi:hypothetical protein